MLHDLSQFTRMIHALTLVAAICRVVFSFMNWELYPMTSMTSHRPADDEEEEGRAQKKA